MPTLPPPPAPSDAPTGTTSTFPPPTGPQILRALRAPAIGYAWLLLGALALMVLVVVAANIGSTGEATGVDSDDTNAIGVLIGMPFQIAGMALLGSLHLSEDGISASLFLPPLLLTAVYAVMTARAARRSEVVPAAGTRALLGVVVGFASAVSVTLLSWALAMRTEGVAVHTASVSLFFGVWALTGAASYVGTSRAAAAARPAWIPSDYAAAARLWLSSLGVWLVAALAVLTVVVAIEEGLWVAVLSPAWGVTAGLYAYALGHLGALSLGGEGVNAGDLDAVWTIVLVVAAFALAVATSIAWHLRRDTRAASLAQPGSWAVLPATYAVGGLLLWLVPSVVLGGAWGVFGGSITLQPAFWVVFVLIAWGAATEAASRFVAPSLAPALPPRVLAALRGRATTQPTRTTEPVAAPEARPLTPEERARYKRYAVLGGGLGALALAAWITVSIVNAQLFGPEKQAEAYLDAVVRGDLDEANGLARVDDDYADDALLTSEVYRAASSRITGYEIGDVEEEGEFVTVEVTLDGVDGTDDAELVMERDGKRAVLFDDWKVVDGGLATIVSVSLPEPAGDLTVNEVEVGAVDGDVWLLPGAYVLDAFAGNQWLESDAEPFTVVADEDYQFAEVSGAVASDAFRDEVQRQVDTYLADCMASTELEPENCPNSVYAGTDVRNVSWTLEQPPTPDFEYFDGTFPADLSYGESGLASVTYESDESYGFGRRDWQSQAEETELYLGSIVVTQEGDDLVVEISD